MTEMRDGTVTWVALVLRVLVRPNALVDRSGRLMVGLSSFQHTL